MADLTLVRGATGVIVTTVTPAALVTGSSIYFMAKRRISDLDAAAILSKSTVGGGITVTSSVDGTIAIAIDPADTRVLDNHRLLLQYEVEIEKAGAIYPVDSGTLTITPEIIQRAIV